MLRARTLLVTLIAVLLLAAPAAAQRPPDRELRVITFNIHHGADGAEQLDLERVADVIEDSGADVATLQEVDRHWGARSAFADQAAELGRRLDMRAVYAANLDLDPLEPEQPRRQYGTAILSRFPIASWQNTLLPRPNNGEQRGLLEAVLKVRGVRVRLEAPDRRIDYVLTSPSIGARHAEVVATGASDHLPVVADLAIPKGAR